MTPLRFAFLGSDEIALPLLDRLMSERGQVELVAVYTQPDRPVGRGQKVLPNAIKTWAMSGGIPVFQPEKLTDDVRVSFSALHLDFALVMAYGHILREEFMAGPRLGILNLHTSILPHYRGASPIQTAIVAGESETGVSLMRIVRRLDAGPVADVERVAIGPRDTAADLEGKLANACVPLVIRNLAALGGGTLNFVSQDDASATFCRRLEKSDGVLDFSGSAAALAARINGLFPWPGCTVEINGQAIKFGLAEALIDDPAGANVGPAVVLGSENDGLLVSTGRGILRVLRLQKPGGKMLGAAEFLRGFPIVAGTLLTSTPMPTLVGNAPFKK
jgi:methionyl-tRNA formyltransferase